MNLKEKINAALFWIFAAAGLGIVLAKFLGSQDQPMETKILTVFLTFAAGAVLFRWIQKRTASERLRRFTAEAVEWSDTGISAVALAFLIMAFIVQAFKIPSGSMQPTLLIGDHLFVNKFIYGTQVPFTLKRLWTLKAVRRYDVVVFLCPPQALSEDERRAGVKKDFIKRAIGLPGDTVEIRNKAVYVNGQPLSDPNAHFAHEMIYPKPKLWKSREEYQSAWERGDFSRLPIEFARDNFGPIQVPPGTIFVMGDNRDGSFDGRFWGPLDQKYLKGKAWLVYWPLRRIKLIR